jgi:hypothetical protein
MMISTTLRHEAIRAADHWPDLELGPCAAGVVHRWDRPEDRAAAWWADRAQVAPADHAKDPARASAQRDSAP